ncbi:MAG: SGNH/GDSL hydrolase family protein [Deltaproteobacteria bacterium]|nr:SGNH/GDSL hydrolase family protein [Deltaproteobacteria bacterium]
MANNNLILLERFNGDLSSWTLDTTGGAVSIVTQDYSTKLKLDDTSGSGIVSALRTFTEPSGKWILEYDINHAASSVGILELLDSANNAIVTVDLGSTASTLSFSTDTDAASTASFSAGVYKQVILVVDNAAHTVKCYITGSASYPGDSLTQVGTSKSYSGTAIAKLRFKTGVATTGIVYIDEVKIYAPDIFVIGDSITDGKFYWSTNPGSGYRLAAKEDETSSPSYQLSQMLGSSVWVANRGFGSARSGDVDSVIQSNVIDHGAQKVFLGIGTNDIYDSTVLTTIQTNINSIITKLQNAGITGANILIGNIIPRSTFSAAQNSERRSLSRWLYSRAQEIGAKYVDLNDALKSSSNENAINSSYAETDGVHLNPTGSEIFALTLGAQLRSYNGMNIARSAYGASDERLFPQGFAPSAVGRTATFPADFTVGVFKTRTAVLDFLKTIYRDGSMNLEWPGLIAVGQTRQFPVEWVKTIAQDRSLNVELGTVDLQRLYSLVLTRLATSAYTAPDNTALQLLKKHIFNGLRFTALPGGTEKIELLDDDNTTVLKTWTWDPATKVRTKAL